MKESRSEQALRLGYGKWMKGKKCPGVIAANKKRKGQIKVERVKKVCEECTKTLWVNPVWNLGKRFCNRKCYEAYRAREMRTATCLFCTKEFETPKKGITLFCSRRCYYKASKFISGPQLQLFCIIKKQHLSARLNESVKTSTHHKVADILVPELKIIFEYDEPYWHNSEKDLIRDKELTTMDYKVIHYVQFIPTLEKLSLDVHTCLTSIDSCFYYYKEETK